ncbi:MAG: symmetrical bis(5'-nucleosyl)-tetraphosphatase [Pseudomonadota bacterium]
MATYAIGDIQGCFNALLTLLKRCQFDPSHDRLWLVGDLVNRGPNSLQTLRFVRALGDAAITVLGNHDIYLLLVAEGLQKRAADDTLDDILHAPDRQELLDWLRQRPLCHTEREYCLVHAGLLPQWTTQQARALAAEVEQALRASDYRTFMAQLWGSEPTRWDDNLCGWPRLRVIVNAMTRMRFCSLEGSMSFKARGKPETAPAGQYPWFQIPGRLSADKVIVAGHWSALGLRIEDNFLALDSGCLWGGQLTALRLEDRQVFQVECPENESFSAALPNSDAC